MPNKLFIIIGPSGVGKAAIMRGVLKVIPELQKAVTYTIRRKRRFERESVDHYFTSKKEFEEMIRDGKFLEWALVHNRYYGTPKKELNELLEKGPVLIELDVRGVENILNQMKNVVTIFIEPDDPKNLLKRIKRRERPNEKDVKVRMKTMEFEMKMKNNYDYLVTNRENELDKAISEVCDIIKKESLPRQVWDK
ncbi:MAG: guanylate kinase [bacterium]